MRVLPGGRPRDETPDPEDKDPDTEPGDPGLETPLLLRLIFPAHLGFRDR